MRYLIIFSPVAISYHTLCVYIICIFMCVCIYIYLFVVCWQPNHVLRKKVAVHSNARHFGVICITDYNLLLKTKINNLVAPHFVCICVCVTMCGARANLHYKFIHYLRFIISQPQSR
jgi:hypothetical protein